MQFFCVFVLKHNLFQQLKMIENNKFNHLINILTLHLTCRYLGSVSYKAQ